MAGLRRGEGPRLPTTRDPERGQRRDPGATVTATRGDRTRSGEVRLPPLLLGVRVAGGGPGGAGVVVEDRPGVGADRQRWRGVGIGLRRAGDDLRDAAGPGLHRVPAGVVVDHPVRLLLAAEPERRVGGQGVGLVPPDRREVHLAALQPVGEDLAAHRGGRTGGVGGEQRRGGVDPGHPAVQRRGRVAQEDLAQRADRRGRRVTDPVDVDRLVHLGDAVVLDDPGVLRRVVDVAVLGVPDGLPERLHQGESGGRRQHRLHVGGVGRPVSRRSRSLRTTRVPTPFAARYGASWGCG